MKTFIALLAALGLLACVPPAEACHVGGYGGYHFVLPFVSTVGVQAYPVAVPYAVQAPAYNYAAPAPTYAAPAACATAEAQPYAAAAPCPATYAANFGGYAGTSLYGAGFYGSRFGYGFNRFGYGFHRGFGHPVAHAVGRTFFGPRHGFAGVAVAAPGVNVNVRRGFFGGVHVRVR